MKTMTIKQLLKFLKKPGWERTQDIAYLGQYGSEIHGIAIKTSILDGIIVTCRESFSFNVDVGALNTDLEDDGIKFRCVISGVNVYYGAQLLTRDEVSEIMRDIIMHESLACADVLYALNDFLEIDYSELEKKKKKHKKA